MPPLPLSSPRSSLCWDKIRTYADDISLFVLGNKESYISFLKSQVGEWLKLTGQRPLPGRREACVCAVGWTQDSHWGWCNWRQPRLWTVSRHGAGWAAAKKVDVVCCRQRIKKPIRGSYREMVAFVAFDILRYFMCIFEFLLYLYFIAISPSN